jgi:DNA-binding NtrC family response regulator
VATPAPQSEQTHILIVDDDQVVANSLATFLTSEGHAVVTAPGIDEAIRLLERCEVGIDGASPIDLAICDVALAGEDGIALLREIRRSHPGTAVVMLTGYGTIESAVEALRLGASDYLTKPVVDAELRLSLERALSQHRLLAENSMLKRRLARQTGTEGIIGADVRMVRVFELVEAVAPSRTTVLMTGESGVGKSLIARAIHDRSPRSDRPFVELACGSIPETLLESELFGHIKGAFTGAHADKRGRFLTADGGTIFLDEINSASPGMQLKLLRVLQERRFEPVGSSETIEVDVRVVLATNQPLEALVASGAFRQDLYYRINVVKIELPPLRERVPDIAKLAEHFLECNSAELGKALTGFSPEAVESLERYHYPGNVRELQNIVERASVLSRSPTITVEDLPPELIDPDTGTIVPDGDDPLGLPARWHSMSLIDALREPERRILLMALEANDWNRQKTADELGINRTTLYKKMKSLGIEGRLAG